MLRGAQGRNRACSSAVHPDYSGSAGSIETAETSRHLLGACLGDPVNAGRRISSCLVCKRRKKDGRNEKVVLGPVHLHPGLPHQRDCHCEGVRESLERQNLSIRSFADALWQLSQTKCPFSHVALEISSDPQ
jgi:hypothetical protein